MKAIGIDIGTTSICLVVYEEESQRVVDGSSRKNVFLPGSFCQDPDWIVSQVTEMLTELVEKNGPVCAIGVSTQMHGILYVDEQGKAVTPYYTWKDESGNLPFEGGTWAGYLSEKTGYRMYSGYGTVTHFYLDRTGRIPKKAAALCNIGDYIVMRLCKSRAPRQDISVADSLGGLLADGSGFDRAALEAAGVSAGYYPEVAREFMPAGLWQGIFVYPAVGDNQASFYAAAGQQEDTICVNVGTGSQVSLFSRSGYLSGTGEIRPFPMGGKLYVQASVNGGKVYEKLAGFLEETVFAFTGQHLDAYEAMRRLGEQKRETSLEAMPLLYGSRGEGNASGCIAGLTEENFHPQDLIRAWVAGMARELYQMYLEFPGELREKRTRLVGSGNGIRKNPLLRQEIEKAFGLPVVLTKIEEEAAAGAAMLALAAFKRGE